MPEFHGWGGAALVTGATSGIGLELARALAERAFDLILVARSQDKLERVAERLTTMQKVRVWPVRADLSRDDGPLGLMDSIRGIEVDVDVLVNDAAFGIYGPFANRGPEREAEMIHLNVLAPTELAARLLPGMIRRRRGLILNVASTAGFAPVPLLGTYAATKAYLIHWTHALDEELTGTGVRAAVLCPGSTATNFHNVSGGSAHQSSPFPRQSPVDVAKECLRGLDRGKRVIVSGPLNRLHAGFASAIPRSWAARLGRIVLGRRAGSA